MTTHVMGLGLALPGGVIVWTTGRAEPVHVRGRTEELADWCAWCDSPMTDHDRRLAEAGAEKTHGMCAACKNAWDAGLE